MSPDGALNQQQFSVHLPVLKWDKWLIVPLDVMGVFDRQRKNIDDKYINPLGVLNNHLLFEAFGINDKFGPMNLKKIISTLEAAGYEFVREYDFLENYYFFEFKNKP